MPDGDGLRVQLEERPSSLAIPEAVQAEVRGHPVHPQEQGATAHLAMPSGDDAFEDVLDDVERLVLVPEKLESASVD